MPKQQKTHLKWLLKRFIDKHKGWIKKSVLEDEAISYGFLADNGARRLRELARDGLIERKLEKGRHCKLVWYKRI